MRTLTCFHKTLTPKPGQLIPLNQWHGKKVQELPMGPTQVHSLPDRQVTSSFDCTVSAAFVYRKSSTEQVEYGIQTHSMYSFTAKVCYNRF